MVYTYLMKWRLHNLTIESLTNDTGLQAQWERSFASLPVGASPADIYIQLEIIDQVPAAPEEEPTFGKGELLQYYLCEQRVVAHFPKFGQLHLDLSTGETTGRIVREALTTYGVLEDLIAVSLSPHLRRRGMFLIHAFAAAIENQAVLLVGGIGVGKTTTGMSLLNANWRLISNDSPILAAGGQVLSYPGVLAAYPDTFARFASTAKLAKQVPAQTGRRKLTVQAEAIWPGIWLDQAPLGAILFPRIEPISQHGLEPISQAEALRRLLPHAIEQWDKAMMPAHLQLLSELVKIAPAYILQLAPDVASIPETIRAVF